MSLREEASQDNLNERLKRYLQECLDPAIKKGEAYDLSVEETIFGLLQTTFMMCVVSEDYDVKKAEAYFELMGGVAIKAYKQLHQIDEDDAME